MGQRVPYAYFKHFCFSGSYVGQTDISWQHTTDNICVPRLFPADALWALCIAWNVYLRFFYRYDTKQLRQLEWRYVLFCYALPFIPALTLLFIQTPSKGKAYGNAVVS